MKKYISLLYICFLLIPAFIVNAQEVDMQPEDREIYDKYISSMKQKSLNDLQEVIMETARFFLGTPYVGATLEKEPERLVINLREMDCTTFVENVLALSRTFPSEDTSWENFCRNLREIRYRNGKVDGYLSRLHYATDWLYNNEEKGILKDVTHQAGGITFPLKVNFMSTHPESYLPLKNQPGLLPGLKDIEQRINHRSYYYIPEASINTYTSRMQDGDIVFFTTKIDGLDVTHMGIINEAEGKITFIHASSTAKKVIINPEPLKEYVEKIKNNTGIILARPMSFN